MKPKIQVAKTLDELSVAAADRITDIAKDAIEKRDTFSVSLAGGSTPKSLYSLLASEKYRTLLDWSKGTFFFGDERNVPPDSLESNYRMAHETLLGPLKIDPHRIHRWRTDFQDIEKTVSEYETRLREFFDGSTPGFDLMLLGLGTDAHTASLFPHTAALQETEKFAVANWVEKLNDHRFTITFPVINNAANLIFLVSGGDKADAVASVIEGPLRPDKPAQKVNSENGNLYWFLDEEAAAQLKAR